MPLVPGPPPQPGDLIEFSRPFYQHWGVYVGGGYVVHLTDQEGISSLSSAFGGSAVVRKERLENVANGCIYKVTNVATYTAIGGGIFAAVLTTIAFTTRNRRQNQ
ncbi:hypothetical protein GDO81_016337 [Engystomops pustulosus]|uniref:LRAT domain-containing protein n=1 Tax=Engystomops pustulosus TaxID=76066 RepID=A0AAV7B1B5_ENGPU|nr:hypothetical protein GDO81_016337 [Engystomops pustulosus]